MLRELESKTVEVIEMTDDLLVCREIITHKIIIDQKDLANKQVELDAAKFAKEEAERKINILHAEMAEAEQLVNSVKEKLEMQKAMEEMNNG